MKAILTLPLCLFLSVAMLHAQISGPEQDCIGALPVCQTLIVQNNYYEDRGEIDDFDRSTSCLSNGENNSVWYTFTVTASGMLEFVITPNIPQDFDFVLYNLTGHSCEDIYDGSLEVRCSYSALSFDSTGLLSGHTETSAGSSGDYFLAPLQVAAGETYVLMIDKFNNDPTGFTLDFNPYGNSTASIVDSVSPQIDSVFTSCTNNSMITVLFSEPVQCSSIKNNFTISGPSVVTVVDNNCNSYSGAQIELQLSDSLLPGESYTLHFNPVDGATAIGDACGNTFWSAQTIPLESPNWVRSDFTYSCNELDFDFTNLSRGDSATYLWTFGDDTDTTTQNPDHEYAASGSYQVQLIAETSECADTFKTTVFVLDTFYADFSVSPDLALTHHLLKFTDNSPYRTLSLWTFDGGDTIRTRRADHTFITAGSHEVCLISARDCYSDTLCKLVDVYLNTSVNTLQNTHAVEIFPNPASNVVRVRLHGITNIKGEAILYTAIGQNLVTYPLTSILEIDLNSFPSGIYLLKVNTLEFSAVKQVVKL